MKDVKIVELDQTEMAVRLLEAMFVCTRPAGMTAEQALDDSERRAPGNKAALLRGAVAAFTYVCGQVEGVGGGKLIRSKGPKTLQ